MTAAGMEELTQFSLYYPKLGLWTCVSPVTIWPMYRFQNEQRLIEDTNVASSHRIDIVTHADILRVPSPPPAFELGCQPQAKKKNNRDL